MHRFLRLARKIGTAKSEHALHLKACEESGEVIMSRGYSKLPAEYENFYKGFQQPIRCLLPVPCLYILLDSHSEIRMYSELGRMFFVTSKRTANAAASSLRREQLPSCWCSQLYAMRTNRSSLLTEHVSGECQWKEPARR